MIRACQPGSNSFFTRPPAAGTAKPVRTPPADTVELSLAQGSPAQFAHSQLHCALRETMRQAHIPGMSVLAFRGTEVVFEGHYGLAKPEEQQSVDPDTLFDVASVSKSVAVLPVLQLIEEGKIRLDDDINRYLPFPVRNPRYPDHPITVRMVLTHTSGIADSESLGETEREGDPVIAMGDFLAGYLQPGGQYYREENFLDSPPGQQYAYSNVGSGLAAMLAEATTNQPFDRLLAERVLEPLGLGDTTYRLAESDPKRLATPTGWAGAWYGFPHTSWPIYPAGELRSTARELGRLYGSLLTGGIVGPALLQEAFSRQLEEGGASGQGQGLMFYHRRLGDRDTVGHSGACAGTSAQVCLDPARQEGVIVLTNSNVIMDWMNDPLAHEIFLDIPRQVLDAIQEVGKPG
jgi:CubicO group peptidase (beta-lactamase class C family)